MIPCPESGARVSLAETAKRDARIANLQARLFDHTGHVIRGLPRAEARALVAEINELRAANGWKLIDMTGRWRRPRRNPT